MQGGRFDFEGIKLQCCRTVDTCGDDIFQMHSFLNLVIKTQYMLYQEWFVCTILLRQMILFYFFSIRFFHADIGASDSESESESESECEKGSWMIVVPD